MLQTIRNWAASRVAWVRRRRGWVLLGAGVAVVLALAIPGRPIVHIAWTLLTDASDRVALPAGLIDDASRLNRTSVSEVWPIPSDPDEAERRLRERLAGARAANVPVSIAGARHSMGGQTFVRDGLVIDMLPFKSMQLREDVLHAQAGARWSDILVYLNGHGRSVGIMQGFNLFTIGGSMSVNVHGWQHDAPPFASSVHSFRLMRADGSILRCSRTENADLFGAALGGYGLFGIILDAEIAVVPNEFYRMKHWAGASEDYPAALRASIDQGVGMCYGRLRVDRESFLQEALLYTLTRDPDQARPLGPLRKPAGDWYKRALFRGSIGSDYGKRLRWAAERAYAKDCEGTIVARNDLLNDSVESIESRSEATVEILQEYFVPHAAFASFLVRLREIIPRHGADLLNATIRTVRQDHDTVLAYARTDVLALVLYFSLRREAAADQAMGGMTREIIDAALQLDGSYYLPYRLQASKEQFRRAYGRWDEFVALKRKHDPDGVFQNHLWRAYSP